MLGVHLLGLKYYRYLLRRVRRDPCPWRMRRYLTRTLNNCRRELVDNLGNPDWLLYFHLQQASREERLRHQLNERGSYVRFQLHNAPLVTFDDYVLRAQRKRKLYLLRETCHAALPSPFLRGDTELSALCA